MHIECSGRSYAVLSFSLEESVWMYSPVVRMSSPDVLPSSRWTWGGSTLEYEVVSVTVDGAGHYLYTSYPAGYWDYHHRMSLPVCREGTIAELCSDLGLSFVTSHSYQQLVRHWWVFGSMRGRRLFDTLVLGSGCIDGGCSTFHYNMAGDFVFADLLAMRGCDPVFSFSGVMQSYSATRESSVEVPGVVDFCFDGDMGVGDYVRVEFDTSSLLGGFKSYISNDELKSYREWRMRHQYWRTVLRSREFEFSVVVLGGTPQVGCVCLNQDGSSGGTQLVCTRYELSYTGTEPSVRLSCLSL